MAKDGLGFYYQGMASRPFGSKELLRLYNSNFFDPARYRAIILSGTGMQAEIQDAQIGQGIQPLVLMPDGSVQERVASEGDPLVLNGGILQTLPENSTLVS